MKRSLPALFVVLLTVLSSVAQLNYERLQTLDFSNQIGGFVPAKINKDNGMDLVSSYINQDYIGYRINENSYILDSHEEFGPLLRISLEKKSSKRELHMCDINNDSFDDIIFSEYDNSRVGIAINNQQSQFNDIYYFNSGSKPTKILSADFNKDQFMDLALICEGSKQVQVYLGNKASKLTEPVGYSMIGTPSDMELKDVNNDGNNDIIVCDKDNNQLQLFTGNGDGTFTQGLNIETRSSPSNLEIADLDGDLLMDVAVVFNGSSIVQVF